MKMKKVLCMLLLLAGMGSMMAQQTQEEYLKEMNDRAEKIVNTLYIQNETLAKFMHNLIAQQYIELGKINDAYLATEKKIKASDLSKEEKDKQLQAAYYEQRFNLTTRHHYFVSNLMANLTPEQIEKVKDGMTMGVYPVTYQSHLEMIPSLKEEEKAYIRAALMEAREYAMDCSDSKVKHAWFAKYKGRFNNYLVKECGYDLKKEREAWNQRKEAQEKEAQNKK